MSIGQSVRSRWPNLKNYFLTTLKKVEIPYKQQSRVNFIINGVPCILLSSNSSYKQSIPFNHFFWIITAKHIEEMKDPNSKLILICGRNFGSLEIDRIPEYPNFEKIEEADRIITDPPFIENLLIFDMAWIKEKIGRLDPVDLLRRDRRNITIFTQDLRMIIERNEIPGSDVREHSYFRLDKLEISFEKQIKIKEIIKVYAPKPVTTAALTRIAIWLQGIDKEKIELIANRGESELSRGKIKLINYRIKHKRNLEINEIVNVLEENKDELKLKNVRIYFDYPIFRDSDFNILSSTITLISFAHGIVIIFPSSHTKVEHTKSMLFDQIEEYYYLLLRLLTKSKMLRKQFNNLRMLLHPIFYDSKNRYGLFDNNNNGKLIETKKYFPLVICGNNQSFLSYFHTLYESLSEFPYKVFSENPYLFEELISIVEGSKVLEKTSKEIINSLPALFDGNQLDSITDEIRGTKIIFGAPGTGKTIVLSAKAALLHLFDPDAIIAFTFYNNITFHTIRSLIQRYYQYFSGNRLPDWSRILLMRAWGGLKILGIYSDISKMHNIKPVEYVKMSEIERFEKLEDLSRDLLGNTKLKSIYDYTFIDSAERFPKSFIHLCRKVTANQNLILTFDESYYRFKRTLMTELEPFTEHSLKKIYYRNRLLPQIKISTYKNLEEEFNQVLRLIIEIVKTRMQNLNEVMILDLSKDKRRLFTLADELAEENIQSNNIENDDLGLRSVESQNRIILTNLYKSQGLEASYVYVIGITPEINMNQMLVVLTRSKIEVTLLVLNHYVEKLLPIIEENLKRMSFSSDQLFILNEKDI